MRIASVVLDIPTQALQEPYYYGVLPEQDGEYPVEVGCVVVVEFGRREASGFVVALGEAREMLANVDIDIDKIKYVKRAVSSSFFDEEGALCAMHIARTYIAPLADCVRLFTPPGGVPRMKRSRSGYWYLAKPRIGEVDDRWVVATEKAASFKPRRNAFVQMKILDALKRGELRVTELTVEFGQVSSALKTLSEKGIVRIETRRRMRSPFSRKMTHYEAAEFASSNQAHISADAGDDQSARGAGATPQPLLTQPLQLNADQKRAISVIETCARREDGSVVLVDGVTGSGKTEVYLQAIASTLERGRNAIVLVPEISLTPQTVARFRGRFGDKVAVMHSRMSDGERYDQWEFIQSGEARVVVGARSALFTPLANVGIIVIDEEHEGTYKQESTPRYHAREVARYMATRAGAVLVLGSATPSIESLYCAYKMDNWQRVALPKRASGQPLPPIKILDKSSSFSSGDRHMFAYPLRRAIHDELKAHHKVVLFLNQRGFAQFVLCRDCGHVPQCPSCSLSLTYHEQGNALVCHHCGYRTLAPAKCPECQSPYLRKFGAGTERVEGEIHALLSTFTDIDFEVPVIRMDADTTSKKGAHQRLLERFGSSDAAILLGTQMIAKGLDFKEVTLVGVINADTQLNLPDYRASERTFALIQQVAGRSGRGDLPGKVMVQTYQPESPAIRYAATYDRNSFLQAELPKRKMLHYPPYVRLINIIMWGKDMRKVISYSKDFYAQLSAHVKAFSVNQWKVLPPNPCLIERLRNNYRMHIVIKTPLNANISRILTPFYKNRKPEAGISMALDIDPYSML